MLGKEKKQGDFFNDYVYSELLPEEDTLLSIARLVDLGFVEEEVADLYSEDRGRPSYPPAVLFSHRGPVRKDALSGALRQPLRCGGEQAMPLQPPLPGFCGVGSE